MHYLPRFEIQTGISAFQNCLQMCQGFDYALRHFEFNSQGGEQNSHFTKQLLRFI